MRVLVSVFLAFLVSYASLESISILQLFPKPIRDSGFCNQTGFMCKTCKQSIYCLADGDGFTELPIANCTTMSNCLEGKCSLGSSRECDPTVPYDCRTPGKYPDPYDCKTFHHCIKSPQTGALELITDQCDGNFAFNPATMLCDKVLVNSTCPNDGNIIECEYRGQTGSVPDNPSMYYICQLHSADDHTLYAFMYSCGAGMIYDPYLYLCVKK